MARYKLTLAYDGSAFFGSQKQARRRTVQAELEGAARALGWDGRAIILAGRTDAGVHAFGQVAALDLDWFHGTAAFREALNARLDPDLAVLAVDEVDSDFHPRFDAISRRYAYRLYCAPVRQPLADRVAWRVWPAVELSALQRVARQILGAHDFAAFGSPTRQGGSTLREVTDSRWQPEGEGLLYEIVADSFLYRMVRRLVFVQVAVSQGRCTREAVRDALRSGPRVTSFPGGLAPPQGLSLMEVKY